MFVKATYRFLQLAALIAIVTMVGIGRVSAQGGAAVTAYSPYTMFGIGELQTIGTTPMRSMGGTGVAWRSTQMPSLVNPAGYSATMRKSFILGFGLEGNFLQNSQYKYDAAGAYSHAAKNAKNSINIHEVAVQFPVAKGLGIGMSLMPYSSVGYKMSMLNTSADIAGNVGSVRYTYSGDGDVTEVKLGIGWEPVKNLSIGIAAKYYWGKITHEYAANVDNAFVGTGAFFSMMGEDIYAISDFKFQVGLQWSIISNDKRALTLGATYDYGGRLRSKVTENIYLDDLYKTTVHEAQPNMQMRLPHAAKAGLMYQDPKFAAAVEYEFQAWGSGNEGYFEESVNGGVKVKYVDTHTAKMGFSYTPNRFDVRNYFKRITYRCGFRYSNYYQEYNGQPIQQIAVTAGLGFPLRFMGTSSIDVSLEYGLRGSHASFINGVGARVGMIRQDYFKVGLGFSLFGEDYWFVRPKYD